jgi:alkanesulfonate monooxygenase SsuD/methylene tetrahydromethanopterin reductase-like flavin-dependent oxidoreductase (luciferase family)
MCMQSLSYPTSSMEFDVFFSISQTEDTTGVKPDEATMLANYFEQLKVADEMGYGVAWIAQAHLSTEVQKSNLKPVVPHFPGEVGLCTDFFQLAGLSFEKTNRIEVGSAVLSILANGGPIATAERIGNLCALRGLSTDRRRVHVGFSAGRFEFMARPYGIVPRDPIEAAAWPALRGLIFREAAEIVLRLVAGEAIASDDISPTVLHRTDFRSAEDWAAVQAAAVAHRQLPSAPEEIPISHRYNFERLKTIPQDWDRSLLNLIIGSHEPDLQKTVNCWMPVQVFNLSITPPEKIEATHARMAEFYHPDGGEWQRSMMPRTVMVFLNEEPGLTPEERSDAAKHEAKIALECYWSALEGTIDPNKISTATDNAVIGNATEVAAQISERFHPDDRLMCWFDFFNHDSARVIRSMRSFMERVTPLIQEARV